MSRGDGLRRSGRGSSGATKPATIASSKPTQLLSRIISFFKTQGELLFGRTSGEDTTRLPLDLVEADLEAENG